MRTITEQDYRDAARKLGCEVAVVKAVAEVESRGGGFNPDGSPKTLFEGHWFYKLTKEPYSKTHPHLSYRRWTRKYYGKTWQAEQARLKEAMSLNRAAAIQSASWGVFQIMGFHWKKLGYESIEDFYCQMLESEGKHLDAFVRYVIAFRLDDELRQKDWARFAHGYNGPKYYINKYDTKMKKAYLKHLKNELR